MLKSAACSMRLMKYSRQRSRGGEDLSEDDNKDTHQYKQTKATYLADAWFGSLQSMLATVSLGDNMVCVVKTCHAGTPKLFLEEHMRDWPAGSDLSLTATVRGVDMVCVGYKYSHRKVLTFLFNKGAGSMKPSDPYIARWKDKHLNTTSKLVPRPDVIAKYFKHCNKVDTHNQSRQFDLALEKMWVTRCGYFRVNTTLLGMCVVDAWKTYLHHTNFRHRHHNIPLMQFVGILTKDLLANSLTRRAPIPHTTFNLRMLGAEVNVPNRDQDPEVPAFKKLTQELVFGVAGLDPDVEEALDDELPARSVEQGEHGLRKVDEWVMETHQERDRHGDVMLKDVNDSDEDARELVRVLSGIPAKINLIPFNPWPGSPYECSSRNRIMNFADIVNHAGYASPVRTPRGRDIMAACGQLKSASEKTSAADRKKAELAAQRLNRPIS